MDFAKKENPKIEPIQAFELSLVNWDLAKGDFRTARRLAAEEASECLFRVLAYLPEGNKLKGQPRTDTLGGHYNLLCREAHLLGLIDDKSNWYYSDDFDEIRARCWKDPAFGTWLIGRIYARQANNRGLERASHLWQSGHSSFKTRKDYKNDPYLKMIHEKEALFDKILQCRKAKFETREGLCHVLNFYCLRLFFR